MLSSPEAVQALIYTWSHCSFCRRAKDLLERRGIPYREEVLDDNKALLRRLQTQLDRRTVPLVFLDGDFVGGLEELEVLEKGGELGS